jgi:hypothetical protein
MKKFNILFEVAQIAEISNCNVYVKNRSYIDLIHKHEEGMRIKELEFGLIQKNEDNGDLFRKNLISSGIDILYTANEIRFKLKNINIKVYIYRKVDSKFFAVFYNGIQDFEFSLLGAVFRTSKSSKLNDIKMLMYSVVGKFFRFFLSTNSLMKIFRQNYYVDFVECDNILAERMESCVILYDKIYSDVPDADGYYLSSDGFILVNRDHLTKYVMNPNDLLYAIECIFDAFKISNVEVYLSAGTLLGAVRNKSFISWDYDADLASKEEFFGGALEASRTLLSKGFSIYYSDIWNTIGVYYKGVTVDIDFYRSENNFLTIPMKNINNFSGRLLYYLEWVIVFRSLSTVRANRLNDVWMAFIRDFFINLFGFCGRSKKIRLAHLVSTFSRVLNNATCVIEIPLVYVMPLTSIQIFNRIWSIPQKFEDYLTLYYGDWKIERKKFSYYDKSAKPLSRVLNADRLWEYK